MAAGSARDRRRGGSRPVSARPGISGLTAADLGAWLADRGEPKYRARQIAHAVWRGEASSATDVRTLPAGIRDSLDEAFAWDPVADTERVVTDGGEAEENVQRLADG